MNVQVDSGSGLVDLGTTAFNSVPYAKYAESINLDIDDLDDAKVVSRSIYIGTGSGGLDDGNDNQNTAIGDDAMKNTTSGAQNVAIGESTLLFNITGEKNTVIGQSAMRNNSTGNRNTVVGEDALYDNTTGNGNVAIGNNAGRSETGSNKLYIDNSSTISPLIYGDFTDGSEKVQINGKLQVHTDNTTTNPHLELTEPTAADGARIIFNNAAESANAWTLFGRSRDITANSRFNIYHSGTGNILTATGDGNVGVGTSSPSEKLQVNGKIRASELQLTLGAANGFVLTSDATGNASWQVAAGGGGGGPDNDWIVTGSSMYASPPVNVGIGTNTPTEQLEVVGKVKASQIQLTSGAFPGTVLTAVDSDGNASWQQSPNNGWIITPDQELVILNVPEAEVRIGSNAEPSNVSVRGEISATEGISGFSNSAPQSVGVTGSSTSGTGVRGTSGVIGVIGIGDVAGGQFTSATGTGLIASSMASTTVAIASTASGNNGIAVRGLATATTGSGRGVEGQSDAENGVGIYGSASSTNGTGVRGIAISGSGIGVTGTGAPGGFDFFANGSGTDYGAASSRRWKRNIIEIDDPLGKLEKIRGVYYDWDEAHGGTHDVGMIAEEVGVVLPEIVSFEENGVDAIGMDYGKLTPLLVEVTKAQQKIIISEKSKVALLEKQLDELTERFESMEALLKSKNAEGPKTIRK